MNKRIIYQNSEGGVAVIIPAPSARGQVLVSAAIYRPQTDDEFAMAVALQVVPLGVPFKIINVGDLPSDKTFRDAWIADIAQPDGFGTWLDESREQA